MVGAHPTSVFPFLRRRLQVNQDDLIRIKSPGGAVYQVSPVSIVSLVLLFFI